MSRAPHLLLAVGLLTLGCSTLTGGPGDQSGDVVVARIGDDEVVTLEEVDASIEQQLYEARLKALQALITRRAVARQAARNGVSSEVLIEAAGRSVTDGEVTAFFEQRKDGILEQDPEATLESVGPQIRTYLENERKRDFVRSLVGTTPFEILLEEPRVEVEVAGSPSAGPADAGVTIVEFSDFQCPYCRRAGPVLKQLRAKYPEQVRVVYRHMPLPNHARARHAAEASACAAEQERFWEYHDVVFENPDALADADLKRYAQELGLDAAAFGECYDSRRYASKVRADRLAAEQAGITGTPGFVVNGRVVTGFRTLEDFEELVREELGLEPAASEAPADAAPQES